MVRRCFASKTSKAVLHFLHGYWVTFLKRVLWSVTVGKGFSLGSVSWAPIISLIGRMWGDLIGGSVSVKHLAYTWTEGSLINCTVKRFVRVQSPRTENTKRVTEHTDQNVTWALANTLQIIKCICITKVHYSFFSVPGFGVKTLLWRTLCNFWMYLWKHDLQREI